jgi:hypothetical protein
VKFLRWLFRSRWNEAVDEYVEKQRLGNTLLVDQAQSPGSHVCFTIEYGEPEEAFESDKAILKRASKDWIWWSEPARLEDPSPHQDGILVSEAPDKFEETLKISYPWDSEAPICLSVMSYEPEGPRSYKEGYVGQSRSILDNRADAPILLWRICDMRFSYYFCPVFRAEEFRSVLFEALGPMRIKYRKWSNETKMLRCSIEDFEKELSQDGEVGKQRDA